MQEAVTWRPLTRIAFRFTFAYLALYACDTLDGIITFSRFMVTGDFSDTAFEGVLHKIVPWFAKHLLHLPHEITVFSNGSGDTTYDWVLVLLQLVLALLAAIVWSVLDRRRPNYARLNAWFRHVIQLLLAINMFTYGADKFPPLQFGDMTISRLVIPFGRLTPFRLLWGFMASSKGYTIFGGLSEMIGAVLLIVPRTACLGALVSAGVLANVFALNMFYDVPVKLFSLHLLLMALFLAAPDLPRLYRLLVLNQAVSPAPVVALSRRPWINRAVPLTVLVLGLAMFCGTDIWSWKENARRQAELSAKPPYFGIWTVDEFTANGDAAHPLVTAKQRDLLHLNPGEEGWKKLIFEQAKFLEIQHASDTLDYIKFDLDANHRHASLSDADDPAWKADLAFETPGPQLLVIHGTVNGGAISARLHRVDESKFILISRGFHWINEHPF